MVAQPATVASQPDLEVVAVSTSQSFKAWAHGYPYKTVRWHFHPEYELHLVTATTGRAFVGDYIGPFAPGDLVLTGPDVPHNWLSDVAPGTVIPERGLVLQFSQDFADRFLALFPETDAMRGILTDAARGIRFASGTSSQVEPVFRRLLNASGPGRLGAFFDLMDVLSRSSDHRLLASVSYQRDPKGLMAQPMNFILAHIAVNLVEELREGDLAALTGMSASTFSRHFQRATGSNFVSYVTEMRINRAREMLAHDERPIIEVCFDVGFQNLSNFNRRFRAMTGMCPREYRKLRRENAAEPEWAS
ncbi:AraC family transcriptional regulator [Sphingomonas sp. PAMC 26617]|uniref:AraC family transcriptional regulator n=1 Tax=Sphingomonas sp. PAMC 26617 TaxID=1112216 RepID=UPI000288E8F6|nr:AraC family transcriptional regulator [Sphingomonas sp. PAMC 26617]